MIQGKKKKAPNDLKMSLEAMGHSEVQGSHGTKFEADRTGATEVKSCSIFEVSI